MSRSISVTGGSTGVAPRRGRGAAARRGHPVPRGDGDDLAPCGSRMTRVGIAGAGMIGGGMARRLLRAGHPVAVLAHRARAPVEALVAEGAREAADAGALATGCDVLLTCLPDAAAVEALAPSVLPHLGGKLWIDATTSDPEVTRRLAESARGAGATLADAPVTGGPPEAEKGALTSLVGCPEAGCDAVRAVTDRYSKATLRFGGTGAGHTAKLLNNLVSQGTMVLLAEAFGLATRHGVAWAPLAEAMMGGAARSGTLEKAVLPALAGDFDGARFSIANAAKDLRYAAALAGEGDRIVCALRDRLAEAVAEGRGDAFVSRLLEPREGP